MSIIRRSPRLLQCLDALLQASDSMHADLRNNIFELAGKISGNTQTSGGECRTEDFALIKENFTIAKEEKITGR